MMIAYRLRSEARRRLLAWIGLGVLFGLAAGAALAAGAGARRAASAYPRFTEAHEGYDVVLGGYGADDPDVIREAQRRIVAMPQVAEAAFSVFVSDAVDLPDGTTVSFPEVFVVGDAEGREGIEVNRFKVLDGRVFATDAPDEAVITAAAADRFGIGVGDRVAVRLRSWTESGPVETTVPVTLTGIVVAPGDLPAVGFFQLSSIRVSPAFVRAHSDAVPAEPEGPSVRLRRGAADVPDFVRQVRALGVGVDVPVTSVEHVAGVQKTLRFEVVALWVLAALVGLAALLVLGQVLARQVVVDAADNDTLHALGLGRRALAALSLGRVFVVALTAALLAPLVAFGLSPLTPIGLARIVEPSPGFRFDALLVAGGVVVFVAVVLAAVVPVWRSSRVTSSARDDDARTFRASDILARAGGSAPAVAGVRFAFDAGRRGTATPVRSALVGAVVGVVALSAALTFASSLDHLVDTPRLSGFTYDVIGGADDHEAFRRFLDDDPDVEATAYGGALELSVDDEPLFPFVFEAGKGIAPTALEGRAPAAPDEVALGAAVLRKLGKKIGDTVILAPHPGSEEEGVEVRARVVGRVVTPPFFFQQVEPGFGSAVTLDAINAVYGGVADDGDLPVIIRYREGTDVIDKVAALRRAFPAIFIVQMRKPGAELTSLTRVSGIPVALAAIVAAMALAALTHALITTVRRRRRELAILKTLGFVGRQVRATVAYQSGLLAIVAVAVGLPLGVASGRWAWNAFANVIEVLPEPAVPMGAVLGAVPAAVALALLVSAAPGHAAARTEAAVVLRSE